MQNLSICNTGGQNDMKLEELINQYYNTLKPKDVYKRQAQAQSFQFPYRFPEH